MFLECNLITDSLDYKGAAAERLVLVSKCAITKLKITKFKKGTYESRNTVSLRASEGVVVSLNSGVLISILCSHSSVPTR